MSVRRALPLLVALTLLHVALRGWPGGGDGPATLSLLRPGDTIPDLTANSMRSGGPVSLMSSECRIMVLFDSSCPYCREAAERDHAVEAALERGAERLSITWVADQKDSGAGRCCGIADRSCSFQPLTRSFPGIPWTASSSWFEVEPLSVARLRKLWLRQRACDTDLLALPLPQGSSACLARQRSLRIPHSEWALAAS